MTAKPENFMWVVRGNLGLTQAQFAERIGISLSLVEAVEAGYRSLSKEVENKLRILDSENPEQVIQELVSEYERELRGFHSRTVRKYLFFGSPS